LNKECQNCGADFIARRKDAKYCGGSCRTQAHYERVGSNKKNNSRIGKRSDDVILNKAEYNKLLNRALSSGSNDRHGAYNNLLREKDTVADLKAELSRNEMKLYYLEDKLKDRDAKILEQGRQLMKLEKKVEQRKMGIVEKLVENNPEIIPQCIDKLSPVFKSIGNPKPIQSSTPIPGSTIGSGVDKKKAMNIKDLRASDSLTENNIDDASQSLKESIDKLSKLYPDYRPDDVLKLIVSKIEENKALIDAFIFK